MRPVLFHIPILDIPVYGYGLMLFFAFIACNFLARRLCKREGIDGTFIPDLAICLFITGILGGRIVYVRQYWETTPEYIGFDQKPLLDVVKLWDGGLVLYGALFGGALGYFGFWWFVLRKQGVSNWKMLDVVAPCLALGVAFGRIGCLCTGCCYGDVAGASCPQPLHFPYASPAWAKMVGRGYQTPLGLVFDGDSLTIKAAEPGSPAASVVKPGDVLVEFNGKAALTQSGLWHPGGELRLTVFRDGEVVELPAFLPTSIGVNPTQIFETISMVLLVFLLLSYYPYKRHDGELLVIFMLCYGIHRFLNEMLRTDTDPVFGTGLTLSQNVSILVLAAAVILGVFVWRRPIEPPGFPSPPAPDRAAPELL
ncbi:MAG: prolipoprotein diacylglyceryl transferase [Planctomycetes bacterium]|jgi:phosphatidylglycerol:prolipoprotein diacylglycerol transferase|nr:prolipoprotein diacylglyceryl transferase [Planctomycetota bacterium]